MSDFDIYESEIEEMYRAKQEPKIELTLEEARHICWLIHAMKDTIYVRYQGLSGFEEHCSEAFDVLCPRIEQAEGK